MPEVRIPEFITVHLGVPDDASAPNIRVPFIDYIKNVASSEIYPTWPESALRANIYAQVTYALNRIYTEWYRSRGYDFDITNSTRYDQKFIQGREIFEPVSQIVDNLFNDYLVRQGFVQPLFTQYCNGTTSQCEGLSQWGTVDLAEDGLTPYEILQYYYGDDINIVFNAPTSENLPSYRGLPLKLGSAGEDVRTLKRQLNRIGQNYPGLQPRLELTGFFDLPMEEAVRNFQRIFNLTADGIVGKATWYKIKSVFNGVRGLAELEAEGLTEEDVSREYATALRPGDTGDAVRQIMDFYKVPVENLLVIYDDFDLEVGAIRMRKFGSAGTHNGMRDIVRKLNSDRFPRIRIGMGTGNKEELISFVTGGFQKSEVPILEQAVRTAVDATKCFVTDGPDKAMNLYNTKKKRKQKKEKDQETPASEAAAQREESSGDDHRE